MNTKTRLSVCSRCSNYSLNSSYVPTIKIPETNKEPYCTLALQKATECIQTFKMLEAFTDFNLLNCFGDAEADDLKDTLIQSQSPEIVFKLAILKEDETLTSHCPYAFEHSLLEEQK